MPLPVSNSNFQNESVGENTMSSNNELNYNISQSEPQSNSFDQSGSGNSSHYSHHNQIVVTIEDSKTPIVILFGPPRCGKTMTLVRLTRWLHKNQYTVDPVRSFRPSNDDNYTNMCNGFNELVGCSTRAESTSNIEFMLLKVYKQGSPICQILEAPGELYFNPENPQAQYPAFLNTLISSENRKVWCLFVEPNWKDMRDRRAYVDRIRDLKTKLSSKDRVVVLSNKTDKVPQFILNQGNVNETQLINSISDSYPGIFDLFKNDLPIISWFKKYNCSFVPFQTGTYTQTADTVETFQDGPDVYCKKLWNNILTNIRG